VHYCYAVSAAGLAVSVLDLTVSVLELTVSVVLLTVSCSIIVHCWNNRLDPLYYSQIIIPHCVSFAKPPLPHTSLDSPLN
jgi:hypothetical protein